MVVRSSKTDHWMLRYYLLNFLNKIRPKLRLILAKYFRNTKLITEPEINYGIRNFFDELLNN